MSSTIIFVDLNDLIEHSVEPQQYVFMYLYHTEGHMRAYTVSPVQIKIWNILREIISLRLLELV